MKSSLACLPAVFFGAIAFMQLAGCAAAPVKLHADESLQYGNPMKDIAIVGGAQVFLPGMSSRTESVLSLEDSKQADENQVPGIKIALEQLGYKVVYAEPTGVGYDHWTSDQERWVYAASAGSASTRKYQIVGSSPAFEYPPMAANPEYRDAVRQEFSKMNAAPSWSQYAPQEADLRIIQRATGGDTICFMLVAGSKSSSAEKSASTAENVGGFLFGLISPVTVSSNLPADSVHTALVCSQVSTGKVLWQSTDGLEIDPAAKPPADYYKGFLSNFPKAGAAMTKNCVFADKAASLYDCTTP